MQFTNKEIVLAKQLKEAGIDWKPGFGDLVIFHNDVMVVWYSAGKFIVCLPQVESGVDEKGEYFYQSLCNLMPDDVTWLPLWHQCRKILKELSLEITISDIPKGTDITLTLWKRTQENIEFYRQIVTKTDLEAIYIALLEVFQGEN